ncbi:MAG: GmrSD restriction endonuclease domain-containing protein [Halothiobacillaceae bacterium]
MAAKEKSTDDEPTVLLRPENANKKYEALFFDIDSGQVKLPMFQREFVWDKEQSAKLIDSILKGYPIGTFIFWKTREALRSVKDIGNHALPETPKGDYAQYILDGQQRITSLYAIRKGIRISKDGKEINYRDIYVNLDYDPLSDEQIVTSQKEGDKVYVSVHDLLTRKMGDLFKQVGTDKADLVEEYKTKLTTYDFATITIKDYPIDIACDVFSRINTGGKPLTLFEIMVAMTYDEEKDFDLALKYDELLNGSDEVDKSLIKAKFDTVPAATVLQAVAAITTDSIRAKDILKIRREKFIANWEPMVSSMFTAVDFIRMKLHVPVSQLLPYASLLVPFTYFFHKNDNKRPSEIQAKLLKQFFYWVGLNGRYSGSTETKIAEDLKKMNLIIKGKSPKYAADELSVSAEDIAETWFSAGNSNVKAILCLFASQRPRNLDDDSDVILDNSNLKIASSRNYHHFFPKAYVNKHFKDSEPNTIANITLIDAASNNKIRAKAPSFYVAEFKNSNSKLASSLRSHLIGSQKDFGIVDDDYEKFIDKRSTAIAEALNEILNPEF